MSISIFCVFLAVCGNTPSGSNLSTGATTEVEIITPVIETKTFDIELNQLKAFPTAEGAGAVATGGRGSKVVYVTNTNDSGAGSLKSALLDYGNQKRTILFAVGGRFDISTWEWATNKGNFTLAGQTANDLGGIHIISAVGSDGRNGSYYLTYANNMIIRYISAKGGWEEGIGVDARKTAFNTKYVTNVIYDHYSSGFSSYHGKIDGLNDDDKAGSITMQFSLGHEGINSQNVGFVLGSYYQKIEGSEQEKLQKWKTGFGDVDFHHNAYILNTHRQTGNIYAGDSGRYRRISNYVYGLSSRLDSLNGNMKVDYINNVYEAGRAEEAGLKYLHKLEISSEGKQPDGLAIQPSLYFSGNRVVKRNGSDLLDDKNQWKMISLKLDSSLGSEYSNTPLAGLSSSDYLPSSTLYKRVAPISNTKYPITATSAADVKNYVLDNAGAGVRFNADGSTYNDDELDKKYILIAKTNAGPTNVDTIGSTSRFSFPHYTSVKRNLATFDSDRDGMPDAWEKEHNVSNASGVKDSWEIQGYTIKNTAGYTNLEIYLAEIAGDFHMLAKRK